MNRRSESAFDRLSPAVTSGCFTTWALGSFSCSWAPPRFVGLCPRPDWSAIGVIYRPETERASHYFHARLPQQFDAILHIDETHALEPLEAWSIDEADLPETYPSAL
jgi:hypothetical protein